MRAFDDVAKIASDFACFIGLACLLLGSLPAEAVTYPVNGVWAAPHPEFPISSDEACFTVKIVGVNAVAQKSIARIVIFNGDKRFTVKDNIQSSHTLQFSQGGRQWLLDHRTAYRAQALLVQNEGHLFLGDS